MTFYYDGSMLTVVIKEPLDVTLMQLKLEVVSTSLIRLIIDTPSSNYRQALDLVNLIRCKETECILVNDIGMYGLIISASCKNVTAYPTVTMKFGPNTDILPKTGIEDIDKKIRRYLHGMGEGGFAYKTTSRRTCIVDRL